MNNLNLQDNNFEKQQVEKSGIDLTLPQPPIPLIKWIKQVHVMVIRKLKINRARWQNNRTPAVRGEGGKKTTGMPLTPLMNVRSGRRQSLLCKRWNCRNSYIEFVLSN